MKRLPLILSFLIAFSGFGSKLFGQTARPVSEANGLAVGQKAPDLAAYDASGNKISLYQKLKDGPVVIVFYRRQWCPVCNRHLSFIADSLDLITEKGASVLTISPEKPEYLEKMKEKTQAKFGLLFDSGYQIAAQ